MLESNQQIYNFFSGKSELCGRNLKRIRFFSDICLRRRNEFFYAGIHALNFLDNVWLSTGECKTDILKSMFSDV